MYKAVRKFNAAVDPHWSTPEGIAEWGGYATFDHHMGGGSFQDAVKAARQFLEESKGVAETLGKMDEIRKAMILLSDPTPRDISFVFNQDVFEISRSLYGSEGVSNFNDPRLSKKKAMLYLQNPESGDRR